MTINPRTSALGLVLLANELSQIKKRAYPVQRAPALCGFWGRVLVASLTLACAMRGDRDSNRDLPVTDGKTLPLAPDPLTHGFY